MRRALITATTVVTAALVAGCGGSSPGVASLTAESSSAHKLLVETFTGHHAIRSGVISLGVKLVPAGSSTLTQPIEFTMGGPFTGSGTGKLPRSDFTIAISAQGHSVDLQVISAGGRADITLAGQSYELPASSYAKLKSGLGSLAGGSRRAGTDTLGQLGIRPLHWIKDPKIVGDATLDGAATTHIRGHVDASALLRDLTRLMGRTGSLTGTSAGGLQPGISAAEQHTIAKALGSPQLDIWTGTSDRILRKLTFTATIPVTGQTSTQLGGLTSVAVTFDLGYSHVNQPQTITAPSSVQPYSVFRAEVAAFLQQIEAGIGVGTGTSTTATTTTTGSGSTGTVQSGAGPITNANQRYTSCILAAKGDVSKMQGCSKLLTP